MHVNDFCVMHFVQDRGIDRTIFQKPEKLHLTVGTLALLNNQEVQQALHTLEECKSSLVQ